jgi:hypothetical protein
VYKFIWARSFISGAGAPPRQLHVRLPGGLSTPCVQRRCCLRHAQKKVLVGLVPSPHSFGLARYYTKTVDDMSSTEEWHPVGLGEYGVGFSTYAMTRLFFPVFARDWTDMTILDVPRRMIVTCPNKALLPQHPETTISCCGLDCVFAMILPCFGLWGLRRAPKVCVHLGVPIQHITAGPSANSLRVHSEGHRRGGM